jgi:hypothetical protein
MTVPWGKPPAASFEFGLADHDRTLAFFCVGGLHLNVATTFGEKDAIRCSLVLLDGPQAGKEFRDILIFNTRPVGRLRNAVGQIILARIGMAAPKAGNNQPVELYDATPADDALGMRYYQHFPGKLEQMLAEVVASFQANERAATNGRVQSEPHPTHAGTRGGPAPAAGGYYPGASQRPPDNRPPAAPPPSPAPPAPPWAAEPASPPPAPPWAASGSPTLATMAPPPAQPQQPQQPQQPGYGEDPWAQYPLPF